MRASRADSDFVASRYCRLLPPATSTSIFQTCGTHRLAPAAMQWLITRQSDESSSYRTRVRRLPFRHYRFALILRGPHNSINAVNRRLSASVGCWKPYGELWTAVAYKWLRFFTRNQLIISWLHNSTFLTKYGYYTVSHDHSHWPTSPTVNTTYLWMQLLCT